MPLSSCARGWLLAIVCATSSVSPLGAQTDTVPRSDTVPQSDTAASTNGSASGQTPPAARDAGQLPNSEIRHSLDYSGQTYWLSAEVDPFLSPEARRYWPDVLRFSVGHSITDWIDPVTGASIRAKRKILLSLDLDASKLPGNHPIWRTVKNTISYVRLPAPAIQISPKFDAIGWYR